MGPPMAKPRLNVETKDFAPKRKANLKWHQISSIGRFLLIFDSFENAYACLQHKR